MHLMPKCILATRTFYFVKCSASHFPKENVQQSKMLQKLFCTKKTKHSSTKCIFATIEWNLKNENNLFLCFWFHKKHKFLLHQNFINQETLKWLLYILGTRYFRKRRLKFVFLYFDFRFTNYKAVCPFYWCVAKHFPKENVMLNILLRKMWCVAKMHFCIKCIFAQRCWTFSFGKCTPKCILASNAFWHQMHL